MNLKLATLVIVASACLAAASTADASRAAQVCPAFKQGKLTYHVETLGTRWTCASAKSWVVKLSGDSARVVSRNLPLTDGPRGYHCFAIGGSHGRATNGTCFTGTVRFPGNGFAWISS
jgi:hypothetical protein